MSVSIFNPEIIVDEVFALYQKRGDEDNIGEPVSQLEHMSRAAALAEEEGFEDDVVLAAFFYDIGYLCEAENTENFENVDQEKLVCRLPAR